MNKPFQLVRIRDPQGHHRPAAGLAQDLCARPMPRPTCACRCARSSLERRRRRAEPAGLRHLRPLYRSRRDHRRQRRPRAQPHRLGEGARRRRGLSTAATIKPEDNGNVGALARREGLHRAPQAAARPRRPHDHAARIRPRRHHHQGDDLRRRAREPRPQAAARARRGSARRRRKLWRLGAGLRHAGIRALARSRAAAPSSPATSTTPSSSR